ncbi:hypothetical protein EJ04DRAFT_509748 [Polyplosphaeria fusca]|uniref:Uncharacterized protein n=1 Tax=Polyplosphaeria fusca TaxID=682080 RepID=A0A9P4R3H3_9PLEO|nr:hypothetical protein EJ04DRAFT_509748 [Polyplosphaeria fusca]
MEMIAHINRGNPVHSFMSLHVLVDEFRQLYHLQRPIASTLGTFSASLGVAEEEKKRSNLQPRAVHRTTEMVRPATPVQGLLIHQHHTY